MRERGPGAYWLIRGYDGTKLIFEKRVRLGQFTTEQIRRVLQSLAARAGLQYEEIVKAHARRGTEIANDLLEVRRDGHSYMCGLNPHFIATVADENGKPLRYPPPLD
jgi:hypothetical protein